jgi:hypothetical protein
MAVIEFALTNIYTFIGSVMVFSGIFTGLAAASYPGTQNSPMWFVTIGLMFLIIGGTAA